MDPQNDVRLRELLKEWKTPETPASLEQRVLAGRESWWHFLLRGYVRVPVPVAGAAILLIVGGFWRSAWLGEKVATCVAAASHPAAQVVIPFAPSCPSDSKC